MGKSTYESARKLTNRLTILRSRLNHLVRRQELGTEGFYTFKEISALEWAIPVLEAHLLDRFGEKLPERELYGSAKKRAVDALIRRDGTVCYLCNLEMTRKQMSVDHVQPLAKGGTESMTNYKLTHYWCNIQKGNMTLDVYRKWQKSEGSGDAS